MSLLTKLRTLLILLLLILGLYLNAQTSIKGEVTDSLNNPVPFASVYLSKTSIGTYSDLNGRYTLNIPQDGAYEMIITCIGYKLKILPIYTGGKNLEIDAKLQANIFTLNEVTVRGKEKNRRKNYSQFIRTFIGETEASQSCKIINPEDLILHRDDDNSILTGYSRKPLLIENKALGYIIHYDLLEYNYNLETGLLKYSGYNHFEQLKNSQRKTEFYKFNRLAAYYGSQMHFLRALFSDSLERESYKIYQCKYDSVKNSFSLTNPIQIRNFILSETKDFITLLPKDTLLVRYIHNHPEVLPEELGPDNLIRSSPNVLVSYSEPQIKQNTEPKPVKPKEYYSVISFSDTVNLFRNGYYYNPYSLTWSGEMANKRIGDMLPSDFLPYDNWSGNPKAEISAWDTLTQKFVNVESHQFAEKVYLHTDRDFYYSGDDVWFKAYVINPSTNLLSELSKNLHVELIAPDSKIILSRTLRISGGLGMGDFGLSDSVPSGKYRVRAYTNHMRNYDDWFFFQKDIAILNPFDDLQGLNPRSEKIENKIEISFFPEGGSLVDKVTSRVAFKAIDANGMGCDVKVDLFSSAGQLITTFSSTHLGMGSFNINPIPGYSYYTIVKSKDGSEARAELPKSYPLGVIIHTYSTHSGELILSVATNEETLASIKDKDFTLILSSRNLINKTAKIRIDSIVNNFLIPVDNLPGGIIRLTLSDDSDQPLCERLLYLENGSEVQLNVKTEKTEYKPRESVTMELSLTGDTSSIKNGYFSLSVAEENITNNSSPFPISIASWFLLESDVKGQVEEPSYYFDRSNSRRFQDLDLLLLTQGWRDFQWKYDTLNSFNNETGFTISGNVRKILNNKPISDIKINLGLFFDTSTAFFDTKTDKTGSFRFEKLDITGYADAFISSTGKYEGIAGKIFVDSVRYNPPVAEMYVADSREMIKKSVNYVNYKQEAIVNLDIRKKYKLSDTLNIGEVFINAARTETPQQIKVRESRQTYGKPDKEVVVTPAQENYTGDVFSYISGRIPGVRVVRGIDKESPNYPDDVRVIVRGQSCSTCPGAIILLNGLFMDQTDLTPILTLPMQMVDRVDVLNASPLYGMSGANGVVNIITRNGIRRIPLEQTANTASFKVHGYDTPRIFYSPKYNNKNDQVFLPDNRNTIYWEPNIMIDYQKNVTLNYYNADNPSTIRIVVEGITNTGIPISSKTMYIVR